MYNWIYTPTSHTPITMYVYYKKFFLRSATTTI